MGQVITALIMPDSERLVETSAKKDSCVVTEMLRDIYVYIQLTYSLITIS